MFPHSLSLVPSCVINEKTSQVGFCHTDNMVSRQAHRGQADCSQELHEVLPCPQDSEEILTQRAHRALALMAEAARKHRGTWPNGALDPGPSSERDRVLDCGTPVPASGNGGGAQNIFQVFKSSSREKKIILKCLIC